MSIVLQNYQDTFIIYLIRDQCEIHRLIYKMLGNPRCMNNILCLLILSLCMSISSALEEDEQLWSYKKPNPSNGPCINNVESFAVAGIDCLGCSNLALDTCQTNCQELVDAIYSTCDGVTLPRYYYYDPPVREIFLA